MKTANKLVLALVLGLSLSAFAANSAHTTPSVSSNSTTEKTISTFFKFPKVLIAHAEKESILNVKVEVIFITDKDGNVTYADAKTKDQKLKEEIEKQFLALKLNDVKENVAHSVLLNFKYIEG